MRPSLSTAVLSAALSLVSCGGDDPAPLDLAAAKTFPAHVESAKALAEGGDPLGAVRRFKASWEHFPGEVARADAYKITLSVLDSVQAAPVPAPEKIEPLIDLLQWAQAKHAAQAANFAARVPEVLELGANDEQRNRLSSNPYLGG